MANLERLQSYVLGRSSACETRGLGWSIRHLHKRLPDYLPVTCSDETEELWAVLGELGE
jgi:hypothetical protein